ncbi:MAG: tetratricopeptide repeat protein [Bacteroidales bacterium]|nr:tetratricopeptide repeat protein [Bacteroidales bacterium]
MPKRFLIFALVSLFSIPAISHGFPIDDKSMEKPILASEKKKIELLIDKASYLASIKSDSCLIYANQAIHLARANNSLNLEGEAVDIVAGYYYDAERYRDALKHLKHLLQLYSQTGDSLKKAFTYNLVGLSYFNIGTYDEANRAFHNAMRLAVENRENSLLATCYQNIGVLYAELGRSEEAMDYYSKALDLYRIQKNRLDEAGILQNMGIILDDQDKDKEALGYHLSALRIYNELKDTLAVAGMYLNLGSLYEDQADYPKSLDYYNRALSIFLKENNNFGIAYGYISLGMVNRKTGNYEKALDFLQKSLQYSKMISLVENEADCHYELADVYYALNDHKSAFEELKQYEKFHDSLYNESVHQNVAEIEMRYKTQLKDREIENLRIERQEAIRDKIRRTIGLAAIVTLTLIIIAVSGYYSRTVKKANEKLKDEVTERKRAEQELLSIKENLEERVISRTRELEEAKIRAEESDKLKTAFIANMSHEIRTPLNAITGFSGLMLREDITPEKRKEYNDHVVKNNKILVNMIEDIIDTSRIESGSLQLHPSIIHVEHFLSLMNEPLIDNMARKNKPFIDIIQDNHKNKSETIVADPMRLQQVLWHILDNAVKFTNSGSIHFGARENHNHMIFYVEDTGIGIPEEYKEVIFEKFRQLDESSKRKYGGTGLGLYFARKIAETMGGRLWFEARKGGGTIFYFSLPVSNRYSKDTGDN